MAYHGMSDTYENVLFIIDDVSAPSTANEITTDLVDEKINSLLLNCTAEAQPIIQCSATELHCCVDVAQPNA